MVPLFYIDYSHDKILSDYHDMCQNKKQLPGNTK